MNMKNRFAAIGVTAAVAVSALPMNVFADKAEEDVISAVRFESSYGTLYYSDEYFDEPGTSENEHLRTLSLALAGNTNNSAGDIDGNVYSIIERSGFDMETFTAEETDVTSDPNNVGTVIAHRCLGENEDGDEEELIVVTLKMTLGAEWANNLDVGTEGDAKGFEESAETVVARLLAFEEEHDLKGAKLWVTGFSRGGGLADQVGKYINQNLDEFGIGEDDLYVYAFAAPRTSAEKNEYANIHDYIDPNDPVTAVLPEAWGMYHTGVETILDCEDNDLTRMTLDIFGETKLKEKTQKIVDPETGETQEVKADPFKASEFNQNLFNTVAEGITREEFASLAPHFYAVMPLIFGSEADPDLSAFFSETGKNIDLGFTSPLVGWLMNAMSKQKGTEGYDAAFALLPDVLETTLESAGTKDMLSDETRTKLENGIAAVLYYLFPVIIQDFTNGTDLTATIAGQAKDFVKHHYPTHYFEIIKGMDSNYTRKVTVQNGSIINKATGEEISDLDDITASGLTEQDLEMIKNGYNVYFFTDFVPVDEEVTKSKEELLQNYFLEKGEPYGAAMFKPKFCKKSGYSDIEYLESDEIMPMTVWLLEEEVSDFIDDENKAFLIRIDGDDITELDFTAAPDPDLTGYISVVADYSFNESEDVVYAFVAINADKEPDDSSESELDVSSEDDTSSEAITPVDDSSIPSTDSAASSKTDDGKTANPDTGKAAFAGGILLVSIIVMLIFAKKRSK